MDKRRGRKVYSRRKTNQYALCNEYCVLFVERKGEKFECLIDFEIYEEIKEYRWALNPYGYVCSDTFKKEKGVLFLHQFVLGKKDGFIIDHINQNPLDNRKDNLRYATKQTNSMNSKIKGVSLRKDTNKWSAMIVINKKRISLGCFSSYDEAKKVREKAEEQYFLPIIDSVTTW